MLQAPTNQDLGWGPTVPRCDLRNDWMIESMTAGEGAVCFQLNLLADTEFEQLLLIEEGMELDLVHGGAGRGDGGEFLPRGGGGDGPPPPAPPLPPPAPVGRPPSPPPPSPAGRPGEGATL